MITVNLFDGTSKMLALVGDVIHKVNYQSVRYNEREQIELNRYLPIFVKYDPTLD